MWYDLKTDIWVDAIGTTHYIFLSYENTISS